jgi:hypothetical protein
MRIGVAISDQQLICLTLHFYPDTRRSTLLTFQLRVVGQIAEHRKIEGASVSGGAKVGQWSGGIVSPRGGVITGHWLG